MSPKKKVKCPICGKKNKAKAKKCRLCGEPLGKHTLASILGDRISTGDIQHSSGIAVGRRAMAAQTGDIAGSFVQAQGDVTIGTPLRDEQYGIALNWDGKTPMREFDLSGRNLSDLNLRKADLSEASLAEADLDGIDLLDADLDEADLRGASLIRANLQEAGLGGADLTAADLSGANLATAYAGFVDLKGAKLRHANLQGTNLQESDLEGADLSFADLRGALLSGTNLKRANLRKANLNGACYDENTVWPKGINPRKVGAHFIDWDKDGVTIPEDFFWEGSPDELARWLDEAKKGA
jgi:hypothetical protein